MMKKMLNYVLLSYMFFTACKKGDNIQKDDVLPVSTEKKANTSISLSKEDYEVLTAAMKENAGNVDSLIRVFTLKSTTTQLQSGTATNTIAIKKMVYLWIPMVAVHTRMTFLKVLIT